MDNISRTRKKKQSHQLQKIGEQLAGLTSQQLAPLGLPSELLAALKQARSFGNRGAQRRQIQYIGSLMREVDPDLIALAKNMLENQGSEQSRWFRQVETWRDRLMGGDDATLDDLFTRFPAINKVRLVQLVQASRILGPEPIRRKAGRELFKFLRQVVDASEVEPSD